MRVITSASERAAGSRWSLYIGIILIGACLRAPITSLGPVLPDIQTALHLDEVGAGALNSIPLLMFSLLSLVAPTFGRRYGPGKVIAIAMVALTFGVVLRSIPIVGALWAGTLMLSAGIAHANVLLPGLVKREFPEKAAGLIGLYAAAMAGTAGLASGLAVPLSALPGLNWRWSIGAWALLALLALVVWVLRSSSHLIYLQKYLSLLFYQDLCGRVPSVGRCHCFSHSFPLFFMQPSTGILPMLPQ